MDELALPKVQASQIQPFDPEQSAANSFEKRFNATARGTPKGKQSKWKR